MTRRLMMLGGSLLAVTAAGRGRAEEQFEVTHSEAEWRKLLPADRYAVLREENTEPSGASPLNNEHRKGTFFCAGCDLALYASEAKYDSGTGWPSFFEPLENAVATRADWGILGKRTEVHCRRCGGHLGHVFNDGPQPTGKRYCMNGLALVFRPA
ncbi:MAG: peptide-methionine (R)-S-oxide reductase MsrB [Rhodobacteraceae bacterium]|nr:peptide-methionine (R)-S-oxide reductase MsrB [Paracoccaceae bacterium]